MWRFALAISIILAALLPSAALRCKCAAHKVQALPSGGNSTPFSVMELPVAQCNGSSFCDVPVGGLCYYQVQGKPKSYGYTVTFGCLPNEKQVLCYDDHYCCGSDDCNIYTELSMRSHPKWCWCTNARCRGIMCEGNQQQEGHSCFIQVKMKTRADGSKYTKVKRGCSVNCQAFAQPQSVQQCCSSFICNAGQLNITRDNNTITSVEQLPMGYDSSPVSYNWSDVSGIKENETLSPSTWPEPTTGGEDTVFPTGAFPTSSLPSQTNSSATYHTNSSFATNRLRDSFTLVLCMFIFIALYSLHNVV